MEIWRETTFNVESQEAAALVIEDDRADVILDPLRWRILEILEAGKSITEISEALDVTDARVLYHVQRLAETGVVRLVGDGAEDSREWRCLPAAGGIRVRAERAAHSQAEYAIPADVADQFNQALREVAEGMYGPSSQVSINHNRARLSEVQAAEFNRRLLALIEEYFPPGKGDQSGVKYGFYGVFTPIDLHPFGDAVSDD
ncbi:MAG: helix-turn-helix domain-containing protein [Gemmatimonadetes bacterium]|nr:helix-turn-helix domain-containing protein [Gemmatimonadota bacterium]